MIKPIAIYLPQFHPIPENDEWWGKGFTEWTNVAKAKPLFKGHYQPHIPADLGYYDLRLPEVSEAQAQMAKEHGIYGFCYYHYWFNGKRLLQKPIDTIMESGKPDFPFMLCWANETWSRRWLGEEKEILLKQTYSEDDDMTHAQWLCKAFSDKRYITINGRPVFIIYRPYDLPNASKTINLIKKTAINSGLKEPYLLSSNSHTRDQILLNMGFDGIFNFEPNLSIISSDFANDNFTIKKFIRNLINYGILNGRLKIYNYHKAKKRLQRRPKGDKSFPCVLVGWDNSSRRNENGIIIHNQNTADFENSLVHAAKLVQNKQDEERIVFLNAWNEWAEGNHLEPDLRNGLKYLKIVKKVFSK